MGFPTLESFPARTGADPKVPGQVAPARPRTQDPEDRFEHHAIGLGGPSPPASLRLGQQGSDLLPLRIGDQWLTHSHGLAKASERYKSKMLNISILGNAL